MNTGSMPVGSCPINLNSQQQQFLYLQQKMGKVILLLTKGTLTLNLRIYMKTYIPQKHVAKTFLIHPSFTYDIDESIL